jgi:hypothetical protein
MEEPGGLQSLNEAGKVAWDHTIQSCFQAVLGGTNLHPFLLPMPDERTPDLTGPDWTGLPIRALSCTSRHQALAALDNQRGLQEEYIEWRVVRGDDHRIRRVELTTELRDYWAVLAAYEPERTLDLVSELIDRPVHAEQVYGRRLPRTVQERGQAFAAAMLEGSNPLNDGREGILFMRHQDNDLRSLFQLAVAAALPCVLLDKVTGRRRCATAYETTPLLNEAAVAGRASDPVIVERLGRLAFERRLIAPDDPVGIYIQGVEHSRLRTPDGEEVPTEWFTASRGMSVQDSPDGYGRTQRLVLEVPAEHGFVVGDLWDVATEESIRYGGQVAELTELRLLLRTSVAGTSPAHAGIEFRKCPQADPCGDIAGLLSAQDDHT